MTLCVVRTGIPTAENAKAGCSAGLSGSVDGGHTAHVPGTSWFMCEISANDYRGKWYRTAL